MCTGLVLAHLDLGDAVCTDPPSFRRLRKSGVLRDRSVYISLGAGVGRVEAMIGARVGAVCGSSEEEAEVVRQTWDCVTGARDGCFS